MILLAGSEMVMKEKTGKLSSSEFDRVVLKTLGGEFLDRPFAARREGLSLAGHLELAKDTLGMREIFSGQKISDCPKASGLLILRTALSALASGKEPAQCSISFAFPAEYSEKQMRSFITEAGLGAKTAGIKISQIDVCRAETEKPVISVSVSCTGSIADTADVDDNFGNDKSAGLGDLGEQTVFTEKNVSEADDRAYYQTVFTEKNASAARDNTYYLVLVGNPAAEGTILLREKHQAVLERKYSKQFLDSSELWQAFYPSAVIRKLRRLSPIMLAAGDGGIFAALWELLEMLHLGMETELPKIKLDPLTVEICETLDISPYELDSGGAVIAVTDVPEAAVAVCTGAGVRASVIGVLKKGNDRLIINGDEKRFLEPFRGGSLI